MAIADTLRATPGWQERASVYLDFLTRLSDPKNVPVVALEEWPTISDIDLAQVQAGSLLWRPVLLLLDLIPNLEEFVATADLLRAAVPARYEWCFNYLKYYEGTIRQWPDPLALLRESLSATDFPLLWKILETQPAAPRAFVRGADFCGNFFALTELVELLLSRRQKGSQSVVLRSYGSYGNKIREILASYTQLSISSLRNIILPDMAGSSHGLLQDGPHGQCYTEYTYTWPDR